MKNAIFAGLSRQMALQAQMDTVSNNIANMSTPGYRGQNMVFTEYLADPKGIEDPLSMVLDYGQYQKTEPGPLRQTGNTLDVALQGRGYFGIQTPEGVMYTRAGNFQTNPDGELVTGRGQAVASAGGGTLVIPAEATRIKIDKAGFVSTDQGEVGQLMVVEFENEQILEATGNGLYSADEAAAIPSETTEVLQGMLEGSNVTPVTEMTRMIEIVRHYQATQRMLQSEHDRERSMIRQMTNTG